MTVALIMTAMAQSCVNDFDDDCNKTTRPGEVKLRFTIQLDNMSETFSRAGDGVWNPSDPTEAGSKFDNKILMNSNDIRWLHVILIKDNGDLLHLNIDSGYQFNPTIKGYEMMGTIDVSADPDKWEPGEYRIMVLANFRERIANTGDTHFNTYTTLADLKSAIDKFSVDWFNASSDWESKGFRNANNVPAIPMWGMTTATLKLDGNVVDNFSVQMLRSVAKVKIELTDRLKDAGYKITDCTVDNLYRKSYGLPAGWDTATKTVDAAQSSYDAAFHPNSSTRYTSLTVTAPGASGEYDDDETLVFYLPEWDATATKDLTSVTMKINVTNDIGETESCLVDIDNSWLGTGNYANDTHNVNRNHLYKFTIDKDITEGVLSYKLECWNLVESAIGWDPTGRYEFYSTDTEGKYGYVSFPSYPSSKSKDAIENTTSFADYTFTLTGPTGAVWKAFLVEDGVEYTAEDRFTVGGGAANTPNGFFFGVGNDDGNNNKAVSTGIARSAAYNVKVGTRLRTVDFDVSSNYPTMLNDTIMQLNAAAQEWKDRGEVPTCYLVIKVAIDGKNFSDVLKINPKEKGEFTTDLKFAGTETHIEIRNLFHVYQSKAKGSDNSKLVKGIHNTDPIFKEYTWWDYPMGHKDAPAETE